MVWIVLLPKFTYWAMGSFAWSAGTDWGRSFQIWKSLTQFLWLHPATVGKLELFKICHSPCKGPGWISSNQKFMSWANRAVIRRKIDKIVHIQIDQSLITFALYLSLLKGTWYYSLSLACKEVFNILYFWPVGELWVDHQGIPWNHAAWPLILILVIKKMTLMMKMVMIMMMIMRMIMMMIMMIFVKIITYDFHSVDLLPSGGFWIQ